MELARISIYLNTPNGAVANGVLEYDAWKTLSVVPGSADPSRVSMEVEPFTLEGEAGIKSGCGLYMNESGL